jgi:hypothetical protein
MGITRIKPALALSCARPYSNTACSLRHYPTLNHVSISFGEALSLLFFLQNRTLRALDDTLGLRDGAYAENLLGFKVPVMRLLRLDGRYPKSQMVFER